MLDDRRQTSPPEKIMVLLKGALAAVNGLELEHSFGMLLDALHEAAISGGQLTDTHHQVIALIRGRVEAAWPETVFGYRGDLEAPPTDED
ncbi:MAG: hypothetical protein KJS79_03440 [Rhodospirillales bacterium]|nr:hypothetical protein [Rhodospirillales bacterium]